MMKKTWYTINSLVDGSASIVISEEIGSFGVTASQFQSDISALGHISKLTVLINSQGGSVPDGVAIFNCLKSHPAHVVIEINGWALSIASFIAMAGDTVRMSSNSMMMLHNPWMTTAGDAEELRKMAGVLDKARDTLLGGYSRCGKSQAELIKILDEETWFSAEEAIDAGLIDEVVYNGQSMALNNKSKFTIPPRFTNKGNAMPEITPNVEMRTQILNEESQRRAAITAAFDRASRFGRMDDVMASCLNDVTCTEAQANKKILAHIAAGAEPVTGSYRPLGSASTTSDRREQDFVEACSQSLLIRAGIRIKNASPLVRDVERMNITAMAESILSMNGRRSSGFGRADIIKAALSTSDFPSLLANTAGKALWLGYENEPATHMLWTGEKEVADFKAQTFAALSEAPGLLEVAEGAEYKHGIFGEAAETFSIKTFGRILEITRQALINDDLQAFTQMPAAFGASARRKEADIVYEKLTANPLMSDGKALFHAAHGNLAAQGGALSTLALSAARSAMRRQKGAQQLGYIDPQPRFLIVPVIQEGTAETILNSTVIPDASNDTNNLKWIRNLTLIADPRLDDVSEFAWYLAASPTQLDTIVRAYLAGQDRPHYEEKVEFEKDAMGVKCRLDFGVGVIDYRGLYKNPGQS